MAHHFPRYISYIALAVHLIFLDAVPHSRFAEALKIEGVIPGKPIFTAEPASATSSVPCRLSDYSEEELRRHLADREQGTHNDPSYRRLVLILHAGRKNPQQAGTYHDQV